MGLALSPGECEIALLGAMMIDREALKHGLAAVKETDFTDPRHRAIFGIIRALDAKQNDIDLAIVSDAWAVKEDGLFDPAYVTQVASSLPTPKHAAAYAKKVRHTGLLRELRLLCEKGVERCDNGGEVTETLGTLSTELRRLTQEATGGAQERFSLPTAFSRACDLLEEQEQSRARFPFGVEVLDEAFSGGILPGEVVVVGGFPGSGKTSLALWAMRENLKRESKSLFVSYEMREAALIHRFFSQELGIASSRFRAGRTKLPEEEWQRIAKFCNDNAGLPLIVVDDVSLRLSGIESLVESYQPQLVLIDYLQLMRGEGRASQRRFEVTEDIMHGLALLAHRTGVAIILLSQLRKPEADTEPVPQLHLLKDSSSIEQAAHAVILVRITRNDVGLPEFLLSVAKNRSGPLLDWTPIFFDGGCFRFGTLEKRESFRRSPEAYQEDL